MRKFIFLFLVLFLAIGCSPELDVVDEGINDGKKEPIGEDDEESSEVEEILSEEMISENDSVEIGEMI